jgi:cytochrome c oxidase accessory protein FixG
MRADGSRKVVHPADVEGVWITRRRLVFAVLIAVYVLAPLLIIGGHPALQLDVAKRRFYFFGNTFNAQDFWMVVLLVLTFVFGLLFVTAWRGRVWCGWGCPQTVFLEGVYRPIERWLEGPRDRRLRDAGAPWTTSRVLRRGLKLTLFLLVSLTIAHTAAALFVGPKALLLMIQEGPAAHHIAFGLTVAFTVILMFNFTWFREQFCVVLCPYGRMQSVLLDRDSVVVGYDEGRGEPRGKLSKDPAKAAALGDCIDCNRCVVVCPTAIDIRNGLQMECLACLQCVDACDEVMHKIGRKPGLIGQYSQNELSEGRRQFLRPRLVVYGLLCLVSAAVLGASLATRTPFEANVLRPRGSNPFVLDGEMVRNSIEIHLVNKSPDRSSYRIAVELPSGGSAIVGTPDVTLDSLADVRVPISVSMPRSALGAAVEYDVVITTVPPEAERRQKVRFLAPMGR